MKMDEPTKISIDNLNSSKIGNNEAFNAFLTAKSASSTASSSTTTSSSTNTISNLPFGHLSNDNLNQTIGFRPQHLTNGNAMLASISGIPITLKSSSGPLLAGDLIDKSNKPILMADNRTTATGPGVVPTTTAATVPTSNTVANNGPLPIPAALPTIISNYNLDWGTSLLSNYMQHLWPASYLFGANRHQLELYLKELQLYSDEKSVNNR